MGIRLFKVWGGVSRELILTKPEEVKNGDSTFSQGLPEYDSVWPGGQDWATQATLERYEVQVEEGDLLIATAYYTDRRWRGEFDSSFQTEEEEFSFYYQGSFVQPGQDEADGIKVWLPDTLTARSSVYRIRQTRYIKLEQPQTDDIIKSIDLKIARQMNKIHNIGDNLGPNPDGRPGEPLYARFEGGDVRRLTWDRFAIAYSWVVDSGVKTPATGFEKYINPQINTQNFDISQFYIPRFNSVLYPTPPAAPGGGEAPSWLRPPFEIIRSSQTKLDAGGTVVPIGIESTPFFFTVFPYEKEDNGWRQLPW